MRIFVATSPSPAGNAALLTGFHCYTTVYLETLAGYSGICH